MYGIFTYICLKSTINVGTYFPYILRASTSAWPTSPLASSLVRPLPGINRCGSWRLATVDFDGKNGILNPKKMELWMTMFLCKWVICFFLLLFHVNFQGWCFFWCNFFWGWEFCLGFCFGIKVLDMGIGSEMKKDVSQTFIGEIFRLVSVLIDKISQSMKTWNINEYRITQYHP